jgi:glycine dehydrogenase
MKPNFSQRHLGSDEEQIQKMLQTVGYPSMDKFIKDVIPANIRLKKKLNLPNPISEHEILLELKNIFSKNKVYRSYIGAGYYGTILPGVIQRNILENPSWYTSYTPYQAEISQGRLEALLNFQTMIIDLTGMQIANASLLDESTAAAEAMSMCYGLKGEDNGNSIFVASECHQQTVDVILTRAKPLNIDVVVEKLEDYSPSKKYFCAIFQYPMNDGAVFDYSKIIESNKEHEVLTIMACDLLSLVLLKPPGELGADIAVGSSQRFGVPMGYGGPHAAYMATLDKYKRNMPGRLIGVSKDSRGKNALRLSLQTREQHIRRDKATSNICTAQVLLAILASMYAVYHGKDGLVEIAERIHSYTSKLSVALKKMGYTVVHENFFDTLQIKVDKFQKARVKIEALKKQINFSYPIEGNIILSLDETVTEKDFQDILNIFNNGEFFDSATLENSKIPSFPSSLKRTSSFLEHPVFNSYKTETKMLRYIKMLESKDISLANSMIPLGSCTMKLNATTEMYPITWAEVSSLHPFVPTDQAEGYALLFADLERWLSEITGFHAVSLQPNAGSQGEYAGLLAIREYLSSIEEPHRDVCLIPTSAHGTNPASAVMAGFKVVVVACDKNGNIDIEDLRAKAIQYKEVLAAIMITYPSTHGVFEEGIKEICSIIHENGGQVYMDGANMNAQVALCRPGDIGADVCHLNLHKTFCIPHGGGGPGVGPIGVAKHLAEFLPGHSAVNNGTNKTQGAVAAAPYGSASILPISWAYIRMLGFEGLKRATELSILNANYIAKKLEGYVSVLYKGLKNTVAHECIIDTRKFKVSASIEVDDIAKRLMDYGFHSPTMSFPVPGTLMIEPTESESLEELDRFCEALISIFKDIKDIETGILDKQDNPLKNAPHTADMVISDTWQHKYSREKAAYPLPYLKEHKYWVPVGRVDNVYGDRNLVCACPPMESYQ